MIGIIGAMEEEVAILKNKLTNLEEVAIAHVKFYKGDLNDSSVVITQSGIGKVNVAMSTTLLIENFRPSKIINTGSAGALDEELKVGDVVVSEALAYHDADATAFGYQYGQIPQMPTVFEADTTLLSKAIEAIQETSLPAKTGLIVSGDSFIGSNKQRQQIKQNFSNALAVEMEATAIAQTCYQFNVPFVVTRAISDLANGEAEMSFDEFLKTAAQSSSEIVEKIIKSI
ncbi:5'-methylthioadenosine/adenosylhomocysteine nucleosidase [Staphylococcus durrellii]|uniref:5'-methylthioadenosine/adenosylhomocysteine nucleosidase n=1 Tax=Staphylococcus durrellii TaxID=2781773 RepID=UPI00189DC9AD|nr:5'-methylthioadenosine/adenosylhomocysteine nucleosidase [Staphylococcus durrellii]MBF7016966.1 5'-methylthioadenosine/adenosylhomocysteine nucleosidase [Staphylococcus durrellii]